MRSLACFAIIIYLFTCGVASVARAQAREPFAPEDSGPIYVETVTGRAPIVEPWNAATNLAFLAIVAFWGARLRAPERRHAFLYACLPILFLGWLGGTLYHGTRSSDIWYAMDFVPIALLALALAGYSWWRALDNARSAALAGLGFFLATYFVLRFAPAPGDRGPLWWYIGLAINALAPLVLYARKTAWREARWLFAGLGLFAVALAFRQRDAAMSAYLPMGSHWLWHLLGAASVHCLCLFVYRSDREIPAGGPAAHFVPSPAGHENSGIAP